MTICADQQNESLKTFRYGSERIVDPAVTHERILPLMPKIGVTRVANITGLDRIGIPVFLVCRPNSRSLAVSQGKGSTEMAARVSGMMESLECFHAERVLSPLIFESEEELAKHERCVSLSNLQPVAGSRYSKTVPFLWMQARNLFTGEPTYVPFDMVHVNMTLAPAKVNAFLRTSNGLSSGNSHVEATMHGLWETIERDCVTLWNAESEEAKQARLVDLATIDDPVCVELLERLRSAAVSVAVWDLTNDLAVPAFCAMIRDSDTNSIYRSVWSGGFGAHARRGIALSRAITEAVQSRLTSISGARDDVPRTQYEDTRDGKHDAVADALFSQNGSRSFSAAPDYASDSLDVDLDETLKRLAAAGVNEAFVADLTRDDFGVPVSKVVVPRLERPRLPGYLPGPRLLANRKPA